MKVRQALRFRGESRATWTGIVRAVAKLIPSSVLERVFIDLAPRYGSIRVMLGYGRGAEARCQALRAETL